MVKLRDHMPTSNPIVKAVEPSPPGPFGNIRTAARYLTVALHSTAYTGYPPHFMITLINI